MEKFSAIIGLAIAAVLVFIGMGNVSLFIDPASIVIVVGGTIGTTLIVSGVAGVIQSIKTVSVALTKTDADKVEQLVKVYKMAIKARKKNILALEEDCLAIEDEFLKKGLQMVIDGIPSNVVRDVLEKEIENTFKRHAASQDILNYIGEAAPSFGMIGTLIGLVGMLANMNPETIGADMSKALLTTFYGALIANVIFIPLAKKLENKTTEEMHLKQAVLEALLSIQASEAPSTTETKLLTYLSPKMRVVFEEQMEKKND